jgi:nitroreductase
MVAIHYTDTGAGVRVGALSGPLTQAAFAALEAPSILNTQPWRWRINERRADLRADRNHQIADIDPDGRLLLISCGAALHHARIALAAEGLGVDVMRFADPDDPDLLAVLEYTGPIVRSPRGERLRRAIAVRHSDQRPFAEEPVPDQELTRLRVAAQEAGADVDVLDDHELLESPDRGGRYLVVTASGHLPSGWLAAGEAVSAVLLTAAAEGLATSAVSDPAMIARPEALQCIRAGAAHPAAVVRIGVAARVDAPSGPSHRATVDVAAGPAGTAEPR